MYIACKFILSRAVIHQKTTEGQTSYCNITATGQYILTCMHQDILYSMDAEDKCTFTLKEMEYYACVTYKGIRHIGTKNLHV